MLSEALKSNTALKTLGLHCVCEKEREKKKVMKSRWLITGTNIGDEGCRLIGEALKINHTLTELDIRGN